MPPASNFEKRIVPALALLLLLLLGGGAAFVMWPRTTATPNQPETANEDRPASRRPSQPLELPPDEPEPEPEPTPEPEPVVDRTPVVLPPITLFRAAVLEAETVLALRDAHRPDADALWTWASTLDALDSRFAPYAHLEYAGKAEPDDRTHFRTDAGRSFLSPDVGPRAYRIEATPRVALWMRQNAKLPAAEKAAPPGVYIPQQRRLQESFGVDELEAWLAAIEAEYGEADYGEGGLPMDIVIFPSSAAYIEYASKRMGLEVPVWSAGFYSSRWDVVCVPVSTSTSTAEVVRHEMFHAVQARLAPQSLLVPWFAEGSAEWLDKAPPKDGLRTLPEFTAAAFGYLRTLVAQGLVIDIPAFLRLGLADFYQNPELNYLIAYCFVDFCRSEFDLREIYFAFWRMMCAGIAAENAFDRSFGILDMAELQRRFMARLNSFTRTTVPPRFTQDAPAEHFDSVPAQIGGRLTIPDRPGQVSQGWFEVIGKLRERGFDTSRAHFLEGDFDRLVIGVTYTASMLQPITSPGFDFDSLSRWLFGLRYSRSLQLTRRDSSGGVTQEAVPATVLLAMVDAVLTDRVSDFEAAGGISVSPGLATSIKGSYENFALTGPVLKTTSQLEIARHTAESVAWYWGTRERTPEVVVVDFNTTARVRTRKSAFRQNGYSAVGGPIAEGFADILANGPPPAAIEATTDWWLGLQKVVENASGRSGRVACLFFTNHSNDYGMYGHVQPGRDNTAYFFDQARMASELAYLWRSAGLDNEQQPSVLQMFALPGAEAQGLESILAEIPQARLDEWAGHFVKD